MIDNRKPPASRGADPRAAVIRGILAGAFRASAALAAAIPLASGAASPDPTFGDGGTVITPLLGPGASNTIEAVARQADGRIVAGGTALARFDADGALDTRFGREGSVDVPYRIRGVAIQDDGRIVIVGETREVVGAANLIVARFLGDGSEDQTFGTGGSTVVDVSGGRDQMNAIALAPDGDILVAGCSVSGFSRDTAILRFDDDGQLDGSFGDGGIVTVNLATPGFDDCANDLIIEPGGTILTGGEAEFDRDDGSCNAQDFALLRLTASGARDPSFGIEGLVTLDNPCEQRITALHRYADGRILAGGQGETQSTPGGFPDDFGDPDLFIARYLPDGSLDTSFGAGTGSIRAELGDDEEIAELSVQADGRIVAIGELRSPQRSPDPAAVRFTSTGMLDTTFGSGGLVTLPSPDTQERIQDGLLLPDGSLLALGFRIRPQIGTDVFLTRILGDGSLDLSFGDQGISEVDLPEALNAEGQALLVQPDGKVLAVGTAQNDVAVLRYGLDGSLDPTFGDGGVVVTVMDERREEVVAAQRLEDGRILVAATSTLGNDDRIAVFRFAADGSLDSTFGSGGVALVPADTDQEPRALLVEPNGAVVVVGFSREETADFVAVRLTASGALDAGFGNGGAATIDFSGGFDVANAVLRMDDGGLVLIGQTRNGNSLDVALAGLTSDGVLDSGFGTDGQVLTELPFGNSLANGGLLSADGRIIATGFSERGNILTRDFALFAYDRDGTLLPPASAKGDTSPPDTSIDLGASDEAFAVAEDDQGRFVLVGNSASRLGLTRVNGDLSPDPTFGDGGTLVTDVDQGQPRGRALAIDAAGRILAGGSILLPGDTSFARGFLALRYLPESTPREELIFRDSFERSSLR